jgi:phospholipid/cholesterol/gamma-HCH transport system substrate-binding protein
VKAASSYFKIGLFTVLGVVALFGIAFALGLHTSQPETIEFHTYFDESVQGLELGAPVKYRGIPIGNVSTIEIAPDHRFVHVVLGCDVKKANAVGLIDVPPDLRAQLGIQGITGVKLVDMDFFNPSESPAPKLNFATPPHTIPSAPSLLKGVEDRLVVVIERLTPLIDTTIAAMQKINNMLGDFNEQQVPRRLLVVVDNMNNAITDLRTLVGGVNQSNVSGKAAETLDALNVSIGKLDDVLTRLGGEAGLVTSTQKTMGLLGRKTGAELDKTLRDLDEAARAIRNLAESIERDPDMLIKGRSRQ